MIIPNASILAKAILLDWWSRRRLAVLGIVLIVLVLVLAGCNNGLAIELPDAGRTDLAPAPDLFQACSNGAVFCADPSGWGAAASGLRPDASADLARLPDLACRPLGAQGCGYASDCCDTTNVIPMGALNEGQYCSTATGINNGGSDGVCCQSWMLGGMTYNKCNP